MAGRATRELRQLFAGLVIGFAGPFVLVATLACLPLSLVAGAGVPVFVGVVASTRLLADLQRRRVGSVARPYASPPAGLLARARATVVERATWRDVAWSVAQFAVGVAGVAVGVGLWLAAVECVFAPVLLALLPTHSSFDPAVLEFTGRSGPLAWVLVPVGVGLFVLAYRVPRYLLAAQDRLARRLLAPTVTSRLFARVDQLTSTRAAAVDASAVELRRVERDLHDGAQVRLVALAMNIGMAEDVIDADPAGARALLAEARTGIGTALAELRDLVRGIYPPVLAERGLAGAVQALALSSGIPVDLDLRLDGRLAAPVESAVYFAVAESLANAARHSGARRVEVGITHDGAVLRVSVRDDGSGGADPALGSGLAGIRSRLAAFDGTVRIASPTGGPTVLDMEIPCAS
jgi:signal transduction histidine kinase